MNTQGKFYAGKLRRERKVPSKTESAFFEIIEEMLREDCGFQVEKLPDGSLKVRPPE